MDARRIDALKYDKKYKKDKPERLGDKCSSCSKSRVRILCVREGLSRTNNAFLIKSALNRAFRKGFTHILRTGVI